MFIFWILKSCGLTASTVRLTVIDTPGFGDYVNNRDSWMPIIEFLDDQHESYMLQEQQPRRVDKIDLRVHACLYFIRPTGHTLKPLDIEVMKRLSSRVNLIPVVAKADTLSPADLARFKYRVCQFKFVQRPGVLTDSQIRAVVEAQGIKIYQPPSDEDDEAAAHHARALIEAMPFAVIGSEKDVKTQDGRVLKGRQYSWGVAEVENEDHCDFKKLRSILIRTHMLDLIHTTEEMHYEAYRAQQMETRKFGEARPRKLDNPKFKEEEESLRKRFTEQVKVEENRFRAWEQKLISERDRLNKDLESTHAAFVSLHTNCYDLLLIRFAVSSSWRWSWSRCRAVSSEATDVVKSLAGLFRMELGDKSHGFAGWGAQPSFNSCYVPLRYEELYGASFFSEVIR